MRKLTSYISVGKSLDGGFATYRINMMRYWFNHLSLHQFSLFMSNLQTKR